MQFEIIHIALEDSQWTCIFQHLDIFPNESLKNKFRLMKSNDVIWKCMNMDMWFLKNDNVAICEWVKDIWLKLLKLPQVIIVILKKCWICNVMSVTEVTLYKKNIIPKQIKLTYFMIY